MSTGKATTNHPPARDAFNKDLLSAVARILMVRSQVLLCGGILGRRQRCHCPGRLALPNNGTVLSLHMRGAVRPKAALTLRECFQRYRMLIKALSVRPRADPRSVGAPDSSNNGRTNPRGARTAPTEWTRTSVFPRFVGLTPTVFAYPSPELGYTQVFHDVCAARQAPECSAAAKRLLQPD